MRSRRKRLGWTSSRFFELLKPPKLRGFTKPDTGLAHFAFAGVRSPAAIPHREGSALADKIESLIIDAMRRVATEPAGLPLLAPRKDGGLFPATASGRAAAERACSRVWLIESDPEHWTLSEVGQRQLAEWASPKQVLDDCVRAIEARREDLEKIAATLSRLNINLSGMKMLIARITQPDATSLRDSVVEILSQWEAGQDCSLPELFRRVTATESSCTIGEFHDVL